jgi:hypothetical protein
MPSLSKNPSKSKKSPVKKAKATAKAKPSNGVKAKHTNGVKAKAAGASARRIYFFGGGKAEGNKEMKNLLGGKGANLAEMTNIGVPVPPGFTITTDVCSEFYKSGRKWPKGLTDEIKAAVRRWRSWWAPSSAIPRTRSWCRSARARAPRCRA